MKTKLSKKITEIQIEMHDLIMNGQAVVPPLNKKSSSSHNKKLSWFKRSPSYQDYVNAFIISKIA